MKLRIPFTILLCMHKYNTSRKKNDRKAIAFFSTDVHHYIVSKQWPGILNACEKYDVNLIFIAGGPLNVMFDLVKAEQVDGRTESI